MTIDLHHTSTEDPDIIDAEVVETSRWSTLRAAAGPRTAKARAGYDRQRAQVTRRLHAWLSTQDLTDDDLAQHVMERRVVEMRHTEVRLRTEAAQLRAQIAAARVQTNHAHGSETSTANLGALEARLVQAEMAFAVHQAKAKDPQLPPTAADIGRARWLRKASRLGITAVAILAWMKGATADPMLLLGSLGLAPVGWWWLARPADDTTPAGAPAAIPAQAGPVDLTKKVDLTKPASPHGAAAGPVFDAPAPPALSEEALTAALRDIRVIKPDASVTVLAAPAWGPDGTATTVFDLPSGVTVATLQKKAEGLAAALGRDLSMVDITKAGAAGRASLWMMDADPFESARPNPLFGLSGGIDAWHDGVPVAWAKRGNAVCLPVKNSNVLIAGMTRSGKGVGAANLVAGSCLDVRINLRVVAGKMNGEFDSYAKSRVASTYFKQNPARLLATLNALLADLDRRNAVLGELGKSKVTPEVIERLGGIELLVIDEVATFTRPGKPLRDEILEKLIELSAVAAGAGILLVLITQYPEVDVIPQGLAMNCGTRWAMRVDNATQSNAILGGGSSSSGRDASKFDPPIPGLGWLVNPFAGVTDLARSFDLDEDERGEVTELLTRAADLRNGAARLAGQWDDPIEKALATATGLSSAAGGPKADGIPGRTVRHLTDEQREARQALVDAIEAATDIGRDAQLAEMAERIGSGISADRLGELLRAAGAGRTEKVTINGERLQGYRRATLMAALTAFDGG